MTGWIVLACVALALLLLSLVRLGGMAQYSAEGLLVQAKVGPFHVTLYPIKPKKPGKEKKPKEKKEKEPEEEPAKPGGSLVLVKRYLPLVADAAGRLKRKIRIDKLYLDFIAAAADPAVAALTFGGSNVAIGMILPLIEHNFHVKERRIRTAVNFGTDKPTVFIHAQLSLTVGQMVTLGLRLLIRFLKITLQARAVQKAEKEAV